MTKKEKIKDILHRYGELVECADYKSVEDIKDRFANEIIELFYTKPLERDKYGNVPGYRPRLLTRGKHDR